MADYLFLPDSTLWKMVQEGDKDVFTYIYQKYATELYRYGIKICPDTVLVEDVLQEVFCRLWDLKNDLCIDRSIKFYLFSTFRRELVKQASKQANTASLCHQNLTPQLEYSLQEILIENQITLESNQKMEKAMDALSKRQKEAVYLKYIEGLSYEEISKLMNIQVPSLYNLIFKALKFLKNHLLQNKFLRNVQGIFLFDQILTFLFN